MMRLSLHSLLNIAIIVIISHPFPLITAEPMRGHNIQPANVSFIASLAMKLPDVFEDRAHFCTGTLIAKNLVLTAAHCVEGMRYDEVDVVIGAVDLKGAKPKYDVQSWITFERWAELRHPCLLRLERNDIAVIRLRANVSVTPANIALTKHADLYGNNASLIGWIKGPENLASRFLRKANVQILTGADCSDRYRLIHNEVIDVPEGLFCSAAEPFTVITEGDSGGPLLDENNDILGINRSFCSEDSDSCSQGSADQHSFTFHTDLIKEYRRFIDEIEALSPS